MLALYICVPALALVIGLGGGYYFGKHEAALLHKIRTLESRKDTPPPPAPAVLLGSAYVPPGEVSTAVDDRPTGLIESKTPERVEWEARQAIEKEALGR